MLVPTQVIIIMNGYVEPFVPPDQRQEDYHDDEGMMTTSGSFMELNRIGDDGFPITATEFDVVDELLWVSQQRCDDDHVHACILH